MGHFSPGRPDHDDATGIGGRTPLRAHWPILLVLLAFAAGALVVPTLAPVATTDDWGYSRSVEILRRDGELRVFPVVAATAVFQIVWGWLFTLPFGLSLGITRLSTVVMVALGGLALYGLGRRLGAGPGLAALGAAAYLFNPLGHVLAFTFMTDPHFTALLTIAAWAYAGGLQPGRRHGRWLVAGSAVAAAAFLTRQQGALIPPAVVAALVLTGRLRLDRRGVVTFSQVAGLPLVAGVGYLIWLRLVNDVPAVQESFFAEARREGLGGTWTLLRHLTFLALAYLGFFALPLALTVVGGARRALGRITTRGWLLVAAWEGILVAGVAAYWVLGRRMPYIGQFLGAGGAGAPDVRGSRPILLEASFRDVATVVCLAASVVLAVALAAGLGRSADTTRDSAALVAAIALGQAVGVLPPSYHYLDENISLDRYLLPLLPLGLALGVWAIRDLRPWQPLGWVAVALFAVVATAGTRDYLVYMEAVWEMARFANQRGVVNTRLDAGAAWDGYHLYTFGLDRQITRGRTRGGPWWVYFYGKATDSAYVVSGRPLRGYSAVRAADYSSWLQREPTRLYLVRRWGVPWPPRPPDPTALPVCFRPFGGGCGP